MQKAAVSFYICIISDEKSNVNFSTLKNENFIIKSKLFRRDVDIAPLMCYYYPYS